MKILTYVLTIIASTVIWLGSLCITITLSSLVFCWQCGPEESESIWIFWPLVYLLALGGCYLFSKLKDKYGGANFWLSVAVLMVLGLLLFLGLLG